ncbi:MAG: YgiQ family radical SAM protein [Proteobacteria bacterium]|nr:MAG: YgiQ family radical SAM protein [Pseudomonadota bacterium]
MARATAPPLFGRGRFRPDLAPAPFLPMSRAEMEALGWDACDVVLVTGDAYVDHPSFGMALVGRLLEAQGFRVGVIAQPDWHSAEPLRALGRPVLYFGVTAGNMDSMVNRYTSDRRVRSDDAYTPGAEAGKRPDRAVLVYANRCREAFKGVPIVIGGIEASLRRIAHFDYWSEKVRRAILLDAKADVLLYGNAERALVDLTWRLAEGEPVDAITDLRGTAYARRAAPEGWARVDQTTYSAPASDGGGRGAEQTWLELPPYEAVRDDRVAYAHASRVLHREANPHNARALGQRHGDRLVWLNPPPLPLTTAEMDQVYGLPYARVPHPSYGDARIPAYEMIRFSITIQRGCFGGCTFCSITEHEGRIIQSRSQRSILAEIEAMRDRQPGFTGTISDLGGPTANMYRLACKSPDIEAACRKPSCVYPRVCANLQTDHSSLIRLYRAARELPGVKKVLIASGVRYDLAIEDPRYVEELARHHVGGYLKIAPEHVSEGPLSKMMKPGMGTYDRFAELFERFSRQAGKRQYLIPYFIAAHPGTTDEDMLELALWLKANGFKADQVQTYLPSPLATATTMYHTGKNPLRKVGPTTEEVAIPRGLKVRRLHKAFLRYHDPKNWPELRRALMRMGREDLIGQGPQHLVPWRERGGVRPRAAQAGGEGGATRNKRRFMTQHTGAEDAASPRRGGGRAKGPRGKGPRGKGPRGKGPRGRSGGGGGRR